MKKSLFIEYSLDVLLVLLPALLILPGSSGFPYPTQLSGYSDLSISHFPNALYFKRSIIESHTIPLWSSNILSGYPFLANPLSGALYPPNWLLIFLPLPFGLNLLAFLHLIWGAIGIKQYLEAEGYSTLASRFCALCFALLPKWFAHFGAGHYSLILAFSWTPWLLWAVRQDINPKSLHVSGIQSWRESLIIGMMILSDLRWSIYGLMLWVVFRLSINFVTNSIIGNLFFNYVVWLIQNLHKMGVKLLKGLLISAPLLIPLSELVWNSTRMNLSETDHLLFSFPPARIIGAFFPDFLGFFEWSFYPGVCVLTLACISFFTSREKKWWIILWGTGALASMVLALGSATPLGTILYKLPLFNLLRVPARVLFLWNLCVIMLAARGLEGFMLNLPGLTIRYARLTCVTLAFFCLLLSVSVIIFQHNIPINFMWGTIGIVITCSVILSNLGKKSSVRTGILILVVVNLIDLLWVSHNYFIYKKQDEILSLGRRVAEFIQNDMTGPFRVYSPSYSIQQQTAADLNLQLADGIDPMQIRSYVQFMETATGIPKKGYSVTLPPYKSGSPGTDNIGFSPDAEALGLINIKYLVSEYEISAVGLQQVSGWDSPYLYINTKLRPRAWVQDGFDNPEGLITPVNKLHAGINSFEILAHGPGVLVLSEIFYPGWKAYVNGKSVKVQPIEQILRGIPIGSGNQKVQLVYQPVSLMIGVSCLIFALIWFCIDIINGHGSKY